MVSLGDNPVKGMSVNETFLRTAAVSCLNHNMVCIGVCHPCLGALAMTRLHVERYRAETLEYFVEN
jgi:hypothetical protein